MNKTAYTRGNGMLEGFLSRKRAILANSFISKDLKEGKILDIGCGLYPFFLTTVNMKNKYGIDPSVDISAIKRNDLHLKRIEADRGKLPYSDNFFNVVTMLAVFEHIENNKLKSLLREIRRILKAEGIIIITTPAPWTDKLLRVMAKIGLISRTEIHEHKHHLTTDSVRKIISDAGFSQSKIKSGFFEMGFNMWFTAKK